MMESTISTRFLIISDTHSLDFAAVEKCGGTFKPPFPKVDIIFHCGDLTGIGGISELKKFVEMMGNLEAELKLVIAGNHDMILDPEYLKGHMHAGFTREEHQEALEIKTGALAKDAGITYLEEGINSFTLRNGAKFTIYTSPYTPEFYDWGFPYERDEDRFNTSAQTDEASTSIAVNPIPDHGSIDIIMTHGPPKYVLDECASGNVGCDSLLRALSRCRPVLHCFGHIHEDHGPSKIKWHEDSSVVGRPAISSTTLQRFSYPDVYFCQMEYGKETLMVNAAIMDLEYMPRNQPWLFDLELARA